jgi:hypothetical protein
MRGEVPGTEVLLGTESMNCQKFSSPRRRMYKVGRLFARSLRASMAKQDQRSAVRVNVNLLFLRYDGKLTGNRGERFLRQRR